MAVPISSAQQLEHYMVLFMSLLRHNVHSAKVESQYDVIWDSTRIRFSAGVSTKRDYPIVVYEPHSFEEFDLLPYQFNLTEHTVIYTKANRLWWNSRFSTIHEDQVPKEYRLTNLVIT